MPPASKHPALWLALLLPLALQPLGDHWVRMADTSLLYVLLALGMNLVVGMAGLLDLGYIAFYALGAYLFALLTSPHLAEHFAGVASAFPQGLHAPWWLSLPLAGLLAAGFGVMLGAPTLKLRGDYLAVVTLGFGEIVRILINNGGGAGFNLTNGAQGLGPSDPIRLVGLDMSLPLHLGGVTLSPVTLSYYLFLAAVLLAMALSQHLQDSRIGRAWRAIREDEVAAEAMGLHTASLKLMAFGLGAALGGVSGALFASFQVFISPEAFTLQESVMIVAMVVFGGSGHIPGVVLGAVLLSALPEVLRYVAGPLQTLSDGRLDAGMVRPLLVALAMVVTMLRRPHGLWPAPQRINGLSDNSLAARGPSPGVHG